jgi:RNA-directed DNA polymerase
VSLRANREGALSSVMSMRQAARQMPVQLWRAGNPVARVKNPSTQGQHCERGADERERRGTFKRIRANEGVDDLDIGRTSLHLVTAWLAIREQLQKGAYRVS